MKRILGSAFFWFILFLIAAELMARLVLPYSVTPNAASVYRNPLFQLSWPEFVRGPNEPEDKLVIIISNSQAFGEEMSYAEKIYFARLKNELTKRDPSIVIENWTPGALLTADMELLSLKAIERKPDLVVFVVSFRTFTNPARLNLNYSQTDISLLAGSSSTWPHLKNTTFYPSLTMHDVIERNLMRKSIFARSRIDVLKTLARVPPINHHKMIFGHRVRPVERFDMFAGGADGHDEPPPRAQELREFLESGKKLDELSRDTVSVRLRTFKQFYPAHNRRFSENDIRHVWVWIPVAAKMFTDDTLENLDFFNQEASKIIEDSGVRVVDLTREVPTKYFLTRSHLDETGHEIMGKLMFRVIRDEL